MSDQPETFDHPIYLDGAIGDTTNVQESEEESEEDND